MQRNFERQRLEILLELLILALPLCACRSVLDPSGRSPERDSSVWPGMDASAPGAGQRLALGFKKSAYFKTDWIEGAIAVADLDGDGHQDIALGIAYWRIDYLPGNGHGEFGATRLIAGDVSPEIILAGDVNGDGFPDLVVAGEFREGGGNTPATFLGRGQGAFAPPLFSSFDQTTGATGGAALDLVDLDRDGRLDAVVGVCFCPRDTPTKTALWAMQGNGNGLFGNLEASLPLYPLNDGRVAHGDLDGDGRPDLVWTDGWFTSFVYVALGKSLMGKPVVTAYPIDDAEDTVTADLDGDGHVDVIVATTNSVAVLMAREGGTLMPAVKYPIGADPHRLAVADFDGDGLLDVAVGGWNHTVYVLRGNGDGTLHAPVVAFALDPAWNIDNMITGDFNEDGAPDLVVSTDHDVTVYLNDRR